MPTSPEIVLFVDDEPRLLAGIKRRLSSHFNILTAESGPEGLALIAGHEEIAVIVADMQMPEMNGIELLKRVKAEAPRIRRIMLTGNSDEETAIAAVNEGQVLRFLRKPCDTDVLKKAIEHALDDFNFAVKPPQDEPAAPAPVSDDMAEDAKDAFLSVMNHELRTPLNHIIGLAAVLQEGQPESDDVTSFEFLSEIRQSGEELLMLVNRILEYTRLQSDACKGEPEIFDLRACMQEEVDALEKKLRSKGITASVDCLRTKVDVRGCKGEVVLALREVLSNAVKFNKRDGHISIMLKCAEGSASVRISDTGCGIPAEAIEVIRHPFHQADQSISRAKDGLGLGLALVSTVAKSNGGDFTIDSSKDAGTTVILTFLRPGFTEMHAAQAG